jgi:hypothetical protein
MELMKKSERQNENHGRREKVKKGARGILCKEEESTDSKKPESLENGGEVGDETKK